MLVPNIKTNFASLLVAVASEVVYLFVDVDLSVNSWDWAHSERKQAMAVSRSCWHPSI